jgi:hypothetical protein
MQAGRQHTEKASPIMPTDVHGRYERERGPSKVQLLARLVPNMFQVSTKCRWLICFCPFFPRCWVCAMSHCCPCTRLQDGYAGPVYVASVVEKIRAAVYGAEAVEPLDLLQLYWWDVQVCLGGECWGEHPASQQGSCVIKAPSSWGCSLGVRARDAVQLESMQEKT